MMTMEQVKKNVESLNYGMERFGETALYYYKALSSNRLIWISVKELKNYHVYKVFYIMDDGFAYDMQMFFRALGYRVNDKFEIYLPYNFRDAAQVENEKILNFLFDNSFLYDEYHEVKNKRVIEI